MADLVAFNARRVPRPVDPLDIQAVSEGQAGSISTEFVGVREYFAILRRHWMLVLGVVVLSVAYTANNVRKERPRYRSASTVRLVDSRRAVAGSVAGGGADVTTMPFSGQADPIASQIQVLYSEAVAQVAIDSAGLRLIPAETKPWVDEITSVAVADKATTDAVSLAFDPLAFTLNSNGKRVSAPYGAPAQLDGISITVAKKPDVPATSLKVVPRDVAIGMTLGGFQVANRPKTDILDLGYTGVEPHETKRVANAMALAFQQYNASTAQQFNLRRRAFLESQLTQADSIAEANIASTAIQNARDQMVSARAAKGQEAVIGIENKQGELDADRRTVQSLLARATQPGQSTASIAKIFITSPTIATNPLFQQVYQQYVSLEARRDSMLAGGASPTNPDLVVISSKIPGMGPKMVDAVQTQVQSIDASAEALTRRLSAGQSMISISPAIPSVDAERRNQQAQSARKLAGQLQDELQRTKLAEAVEAGQVEIVQLARNPGSRLQSGKNRQLAIGILVGLLFGFGAAVVVDSLDVSIRKRSDIERTLGIPGLAVIPRLPSAGRAGFQAANMLPGLKPKSKGLVTLGDQDLVTVNDIRSSSAESFRTLRTNLMYSQAVQKMHTLLITSASPAEGKTTTAANLAVSFAQQGIRVLLLDCDLRRGRIHRMFGVPREPGLTDLVVGQQEESVVTRATSVPGLYLVASGKIPPNPAELLGSDGMRKTMAQLTEGYDLIIVDSPPLLAASDAAILATMVDGVILVLRAGGTEKAAAQQAVDQLNSLGARVVGAVLNDPNSQVAKYGAYYNYQYDNADAVVGS